MDDLPFLAPGIELADDRALLCSGSCFFAQAGLLKKVKVSVLSSPSRAKMRSGALPDPARTSTGVTSSTTIRPSSAALAAGARTRSIVPVGK